MAVSKKLKQKVAEGLEDKVSSSVRQKVTRLQGPLVRGMIEKHHWVGPELRPVKEQSVQNLDELLEQAVTRLEENGIKIFRAATTREAVEYILDLVQEGTVVKSKSNAAKEIGLVEALEQKGVAVIETDLGDRICQLGHIPASHPIGPALHVPVQKVAELFAAESGQDVPPVPEEIVKVARQTLRQKFFQASVGISGANAIAADTGSVILMENEGNIRSVTNLPEVHVVIAGIEKIVPTLEDGIRVVRAAALYGMGLDFPTYVSVISGPGRTQEVEGGIVGGLQGPSEVHLVLLEEGRREALNEGFGESLYCINCGSCLGRCPVYGEMGERYGYKYFGGIGVIHTAFSHGLEKADETGLSLCIGCQRCIQSCPVSINTPDMIRCLRDKFIQERGRDRGRSLIFKHVLNTGSLVQKLAPTVQGLLGEKDGRGGWLLRRDLFGIEKGRRLPELSARSFLTRAPAKTGSGARVYYFVGCLNNIVFPRVAEATVKILAQSGAEVSIPGGQKCCGTPMLAGGNRDLAVQNAIANLQLFADAGVVITDCATCYTGLLAYPELLAGVSGWADKAVEFAGKVREVSQYLMERGFEPENHPEQCKVTYHQPCHLTAHGLTGGKELLQSLPGVTFTPAQLEDNCCGFGGTFNLDFYNLSRTIGTHKVQPVLGTGAKVLVTSCPGCMIQLADLMSGEKNSPVVMHITEFLGRGGQSVGSKL